MLKLLGSFMAGAAAVLAFAPFGWWPVLPVSLACLFLLVYTASSGRQCFWVGYSFGLGMFGAGVYWIYFSLHLFGAAIAPLAAVGTLLFVAVMALYPALFARLCFVWRGVPSGVWFLLAAPALWLLVEWLRSWLFTGFPWLSVGYSTINMPLAGYAPVGGVYLNSLLLSICSGALGLLVIKRSVRAFAAAFTVVIAIVGGGYALQRVNWTQPVGDPVSVTMVQGNVAQELKFLPNLIEDSLATYAEKSFTGSDLVIWPESAIPTFYTDVFLWEEEFVAQMNLQGTTVISGGFHANEDFTEFYNAIKVLGGTKDQIYTKRHLVPFGEFIPFRDIVKFLAELIQIPMSDLSAGHGPIKPITVNGVHYGMSICYEDAFGGEMIAQMPQANVLINISNDGWFGDSTAPHQHQEIAAMRALEFQRPLLRVTNTGITSLISRHGKPVEQGRQFEAMSMSVEVVPRQGATPFVFVGNWLAVLLALVMALIARLMVRSSTDQGAEYR